MASIYFHQVFKFPSLWWSCASQIVSFTLPHNNHITNQLFLLFVSHRSCELMANLLGVLAETSNEVCVFCCVQMWPNINFIIRLIMRFTGPHTCIKFSVRRKSIRRWPREVRVWIVSEIYFVVHLHWSHRPVFICDQVTQTLYPQGLGLNLLFVTTYVFVGTVLHSSLSECG